MKQNLKIKIKNFKDISIEQYKKIYILLNSDEKTLENDIEIVSLLTDIEIDELKKYDYNSILKFIDIINNILSNEKTEIVEVYEYNDVKYYLDKKTEKWSAGMFLDLYNLSKDIDSIIFNLDVICSILYRPKNEEYDFNKIEERKEIFKEMSISIAQSAAFFLLNLKIKSLQKTKEYLENQLKKNQKNLNLQIQ